MPIFYDVEEDLLYRKGFAKGEEKAAKEIAAIKAEHEKMKKEYKAERKRMREEPDAEKIGFIKRIISFNALSIKDIARITKVPISFVEQLKKEME